MSLFKDKQYDEMDWLSKAVEPIICSLNDELQALPNEFVFTIADVMKKGISAYGMGLDKDDAVTYAFHKNRLSKNIDKAIMECYAFDIETGSILDVPAGKMIGSVRLVKIKDHFSEKDLLQMMGKKGLEALRNIRDDKVEVDRANEILELLGLNQYLRSKSVRNKIDAIKIEFENAMTENKWNIRNVDLSNRIGLWIALFLMDGNLAALTNFCKFKVMTHMGEPIYSMEEESV